MGFIMVSGLVNIWSCSAYSSAITAENATLGRHHLRQHRGHPCHPQERLQDRFALYRLQQQLPRPSQLQKIIALVSECWRFRDQCARGDRAPRHAGRNVWLLPPSPVNGETDSKKRGASSWLVPPPATWRRRRCLPCGRHNVSKLRLSGWLQP